jgi:hypothetical protein
MTPDEPQPRDLLRWLNPKDKRKGKRRQEQLARFKAMSDAQKIAHMRRNLRYLRTHSETRECVWSSMVIGSVPGTPDWQSACAERDRARRMKEGCEKLLHDFDRLERIQQLHLIDTGTDGDTDTGDGDDQPDPTT